MYQFKLYHLLYLNGELAAKKTNSYIFIQLEKIILEFDKLILGLIIKKLFIFQNKQI